jgi:hypothetical protein
VGLAVLAIVIVAHKRYAILGGSVRLPFIAAGRLARFRCCTRLAVEPKNVPIEIRATNAFTIRALCHDAVEIMLGTIPTAFELFFRR